MIDGELWALVAPIGQPAVDQEHKPKVKRKYSKRQAKRELSVKRSGRTKLTDDDEKTIIQRFEEGASVSDIAEEMGVAYGTIATRHIRHAQGKTKPEYECENRHTFKSNLSLAKAVCPHCGTHSVHLYREPAVREGVDA